MSAKDPGWSGGGGGVLAVFPFSPLPPIAYLDGQTQLCSGKVILWPVVGLAGCVPALPDRIFFW